MDPVTHAVIGAAISKVTGNTIAITDPVTMSIIIGAVFPDVDILLQRWGDYVYLKNHRGASHSVLGLILSSIFISGVIGNIYNTSNFGSLFLWALLGCLSHTFFDVFNSYGAKLLWPFIDKRFSFSLLIVFDPIFLGTLLGYIFSERNTENIFLSIFVLYMCTRALMRLYVRKQLKREFKDSCEKISILPSMTGLLRWHFILESKNYNIVGEKTLRRRSAKIVRKLYKLQDEVMEKALLSPVGEFFKEFTPLLHVAREKAGGITRYIFIDMRYYMRNNFLHHAILELDENNSIVKASFNPYSINRSCEIKDSRLVGADIAINI